MAGTPLIESGFVAGVVGNSGGRLCSNGPMEQQFQKRFDARGVVCVFSRYVNLDFESFLSNDGNPNSVEILLMLGLIY